MPDSNFFLLIEENTKKIFMEYDFLKTEMIRIPEDRIVEHPYGTIAIDPAANCAAIAFQNVHDSDIKSLRGKTAGRIGVIHIGDETGKADHSLYEHVDYVVRHYWHPQVMEQIRASDKPVLWLPNGCRSGAGRPPGMRIKPITERHIPVFFAGMLKSAQYGAERAQMAQAIAQLPPGSCDFLETSDFGAGMPPDLYGAHMAVTVLAPTPAGNSPETIRLYDALEWGAIPVTLRHPFHDHPDALGGAPLFYLDRWADLPDLVAETLRQMNSESGRFELERRRLEIQFWWQAFKQKKHQEFLKIALG